jgi:hypothetical protein
VNGCEVNVTFMLLEKYPLCNIKDCPVTNYSLRVSDFKVYFSLEIKCASLCIVLITGSLRIPGCVMV